MKRPALFIGLPFVLGLMLASVFQLWSVCTSVILTASAVLLCRKDLWKYVLLSTLSCLTACCVYLNQMADFEQQKIYSGQDTTFTGQITAATVYQSGYARYYLDGFLEEHIPARVELFCDMPDGSYGDILTIHGTSELLESDFLFDTAGYAKAQKVCLSFMMPEILDISEPEHSSLRRIIYQWRTDMTERILQNTGEDTGSLLTGMLFGDKSGMSRSSKTALYRMGIGHVLAVSGLHLDFLALCVSWLLEKLRVERKISFGIVTVVCLLFVICAGETVSVERACIMALLREGAKLVFRKADSLNSLSIAAFLLSVTNPFVIHSAAFWLSCTATYGISVLAPFMTKEFPADTFLRKQIRNFLMCCWTFAAVLPVSAMYFREVSLFSPISNTFLVPFCMLSLLLGMLAVLFGGNSLPALAFLYGADILNDLILTVSRFMARISWTHIAAGSNQLLYLLGAGVLLCVFCQIIGKNKKYTTWTILLAFVVTGISLEAEKLVHSDELKIAVLGTGKNCVLVLTAKEEAVLMDMSGTSGLAAYAEAYLTENGVQQIETLYLCNPTEKSAKKYNEYLSFLPPERVCLLKEMENFPELLGVLPQTDTQREQLFHGAKLTIEADMVSVKYAGITYLCTKEGFLPEEPPEILTIFGKNQKALPESGILIVLDANSPYQTEGHTYIGENNLELTIAKDGSCRIRRLYGDT